LHHRINEDILGEHKIDKVDKKLALCEQKWLTLFNRMEDVR